MCPTLLSVLVWSVLAPAEPAAYALYGRDGRPVSSAAMLAAMVDAEVVLFGELHDQPIGHWLQLELARDLVAARPGQVVFGAEMFEADDQLVLDEYLAGQARLTDVQREAKVWPNFDTDYRPLLELAQAEGRPFIATNIPRRYAALVARAGLDALAQLPREARRYIAPLPIEVDLDLPGYQAMLNMGGGHGGGDPANLARAQAVKDATMAHFILRRRQPGQLVYHLNGSYHSQHDEGIVWYLRRAQPDLRIVTLASVEREDPTQPPDEAERALADFVLVMPTRMTRTH